MRKKRFVGNGLSTTVNEKGKISKSMH